MIEFELSKVCVFLFELLESIVFYIDGRQAKFDFTNEQTSGIWPRVRTCILSKRRNQRRFLREEQKIIDRATTPDGKPYRSVEYEDAKRLLSFKSIWCIQYSNDLSSTKISQINQRVDLFLNHLSRMEHSSLVSFDKSRRNRRFIAVWIVRLSFDLSAMIQRNPRYWYAS